MAANSKHTLDIFKWICDSIEQSVNEAQLNGCDNLSELFFKKYQEVSLFNILTSKIKRKINQIKNNEHV